MYNPYEITLEMGFGTDGALVVFRRQRKTTESKDKGVWDMLTRSDPRNTRLVGWQVRSTAAGVLLAVVIEGEEKSVVSQTVCGTDMAAARVEAQHLCSLRQWGWYGAV